MPTRALRPCAGRPNCPARVLRGRCPACEAAYRAQRRQAETWRHAPGAHGTRIDVYQTPRWKALRAQVLREAKYLCECDECKTLPCPRPANTVDHRVPHRGDARLLWDRANLQAMSAECHSRKTAREGRRR